MSKVKLSIIIVVAILAIIIAAVFGVQGVQNGAFNREEQINTASSNIEVQEKRRADLIPNLVDCVKAYDKHEYQTLIEVIESRKTLTSENIAEIQTMVQAVAENYPELKSNENYAKLMKELTVTENLIAEYRNNFNSQVKEYKRYTRKFPNRMYLNWCGYEIVEYEYLEYGASSDAPTNLFGE